MVEQMETHEKMSRKYEAEKAAFHTALSDFAQTLTQLVALDDEWTVKGFIDVFKNIYTISSDTKVVSKILELHLFPHILDFAQHLGYSLELAAFQNYYPDITFINNDNDEIKFAVDLKTTYVDEKRAGFCNGFTLGSHGEYFINRTSTKNIQYAYNKYCAHYCLGIIYSRAAMKAELETRKYSIDELPKIPSVIKHFIFFATEKWKIASDKGGSGNTANIGSIKNIADILSGNGVFANAGEEIFDDYWANYGKIQIETKDGKRKAMTSFDEYIAYRGLSMDIKNNKASVNEV
jgi:hypothetical protein